MSSSVKVIVALLVAAVSMLLTKLKIPISDDLKSGLGDILAKIVDGLITFGALIYAAWQHREGTKNAAATGDPSGKPPASTPVVTLALLCGALLLFANGCASSPQQTAVREGMASYVDPLLSEYMGIINKSAAPAAMDESLAHASNLYTPADIKIRQDSVDGFHRLLQQGRADDQKGLFGSPPPTTQP